MRENGIESKYVSSIRLAKVSSRTKLYQAILRHEVGNDNINSNVSFLLSIYLTWVIASSTNFIASSKPLTAPLFNYAFSFFDENPSNSENAVEYSIALSLFIPIYIAIFMLMGKGRFLPSLVGYNQEEFLDPFDKNLLEENCQKETDKIGINDDEAWTCHLVIGMAFSVSVYWAAVQLPLEESTKKILVSSNLFHIIKLGGFLTNFFLRRISSSTFTMLRNQINFLFRENDLSFVFSPKKNNLLRVVNVMQAVGGNKLKFDQIIYLTNKITSSSQLSASMDEQYYLMLIVKQIIEAHFGVEVLALDDQSMLMKANKIIKLAPHEISKASHSVREKISYLWEQRDISNKYIKLLEMLTQPHTGKKWKKIFDIDSKSLFSFSLNVAGIEANSLDKLIINISKVLADFNINIYGDKLVVEGDLKDKFNNSLYRQADSLVSMPIINPLFVNDILLNKSVSMNANLIESMNYNTKNAFFIKNTKNSSKKSNPKISGKISYLFAPYKKPKLISLTWEHFHNYPVDKSPYSAIRHACSNKAIFYSAFTLEKEMFTSKEPLHKFLGIVQTEHVKGSNATGSCIKFLTKDERSKLKVRLLNLGDGNSILFKLHTDGDSRVYGVLKDKGIAIYDDGTQIEVKMIEWCIIDQLSHEDSSAGIYHSNCNPYVLTSKL